MTEAVTLEDSQAENLVAVALPLPFQAPFTYRVRDHLPLEPGVRVVVPFGARRVVGVVLGPGGTAPDPKALKDVLEVLDDVPLVAGPLFALSRWVSEHYLAPPGECARLVMPLSGMRASRAVVRLTEAAPEGGDDALMGALRDGPLPLTTLTHRLGRDPGSALARLRKDGFVAVDQDLTASGFKTVLVATLVDTDVKPKGSAQAEVVARLKAREGHRATVAELVRDQPSLRSALARLQEKKVVEMHEERELRSAEVLEGGARERPVPTGEQARAALALGRALDSLTFQPFLLHGVTGSGKTEVYFELFERALALGRGAILLVPEIALTPLLVRATVARFGKTVSVVHSELSHGERHDEWWRIREGESKVVVGARSAVFAPVVSLGAIVVDEEHEAAYKQEESPRYNARDVAVMRGRLEGAVVVLGSATPSVESNENAQKGKYQRLSLSTRIGPQGLPKVEIVDRREAMKSGRDPIVTPPLLEALKDRLERKEQCLLLLNRRGYATSLLCRECAEPAMCPNCSVALTIHGKGATSECHYCGHRSPTAERCPSCQGEYLRLTGFGTEKVVEAVRAALPHARVARLDRDVARRRGEVGRILKTFEAGETDVLVGTQMIAKGHDFPKVTLVGVIDADVGLGFPDFRSAERTFQLLTQVAGRAGRADLPGEVMLQSHWPDHYALKRACEQDYPGFVTEEMEFRRTMSYPPSAALVNIVVRSRDPGEGAREADALAKALRARAAGAFRVLGPARAPLARLKQEHRQQILLKGRRGAMRDAVRSALVERYGVLRWPGIAVDVDPVSVM